MSGGGSSRLLLAAWLLAGGGIVGYGVYGGDSEVAPGAEAESPPSAAAARAPEPTPERPRLAGLPAPDGQAVRGLASVFAPQADELVAGDGLLRVEAQLPPWPVRELEAIVTSRGAPVTSASVPVAADGRALGWVRVEASRQPRAMRLSLRSAGQPEPVAEVPFFVDAAPSVVITQPVLPYGLVEGDRVLVAGRIDALHRGVRIELQSEIGRVLSFIDAQTVRDGPRASTPAGFYAELPIPSLEPGGPLWIVVRPATRPDGLLEARMPIIRPAFVGDGHRAPILSRPAADELVTARGYVEVAGSAAPHSSLRAVVAVDGGGVASLKLNVSDDGRFFAYLPLRLRNDLPTSARVELYDPRRDAVPVLTQRFRVAAAPDVAFSSPLLPYHIVAGDDLVIAGRAHDSVDVVRLRLEDAAGHGLATLDVPASHPLRTGQRSTLGYGRGPGAIDFLARLSLPPGLARGVAYLVAQPMAGDRALEAARLPIILARAPRADQGIGWFGEAPPTPAASAP